MLDKAEMRRVVDMALDGTNLFTVSLDISGDNVVEVVIDSLYGVTIDDCRHVNDAVLAAFDRDVEDYELTVASYSISDPFIVIPEHYLKNVGNDVETLTADGKKLKGVLAAADNDGFTLVIAEKTKVEGKKRPVITDVEHRFAYNEVKYTKNIIKF